jgi:hypothetical protein
MPKRNDLLNTFFNELLDVTLDSFMDAVEPHLEAMAKEAIKSAKAKAQDRVNQHKAKEGPKMAQERPRTRREVPNLPRHPVTPQNTLYDVLEVSVRASQETIKAAYRSLALRNHPDKGGSSSRMQDIINAYLVLSDVDNRSRYDRHVLGVSK